jgi:hypothetical protein
MTTAPAALTHLPRARGLLFVAASFAVIAGVYLKRAPADWGKVYIPAAQRLAAGEELFTLGYVYPPAFAWLILPLAKLPRLAEHLVWALVNAVSLGLLVATAWQMSGVNRLRGWRAAAAAGLAAAIAGPFLLDAVTNQQNDLVVIALVLGGCALAQRQAHLGGACLLGLAAGIKCTPLLWAPYLLWRRRFAAAGVLLGVAAGVNLVADWTHPPAAPSPRLVRWAQQLVLPKVGREDPGVWASGIQFNHSLAGLCNRLLTCRYERHGRQVVAVARPDRASGEALKAAVRGLGVALLAAAAAAGWWARKGSARSARQADKYEHGLVVCLMLLLSPMSSKPHFGILILPILLLARRAVLGADPLAIACLGTALGCAALSCMDLAGPRLYAWATWHGSVMGVCLALFAGGVAGLLRRPAHLPAGGGYALAMAFSAAS